MATLKVHSVPAGLVWLLQKATTAPECFTSSEKGAKKSLSQGADYGFIHKI